MQNPSVCIKSVWVASHNTVEFFHSCIDQSTIMCKRKSFYEFAIYVVPLTCSLNGVMFICFIKVAQSFYNIKIRFAIKFYNIIIKMAYIFKEKNYYFYQNCYEAMILKSNEK